MYSITVNAEDNIIKDVGKGNERAGNIYVPKEWIGKKVMIVLLPDDNAH